MSDSQGHFSYKGQLRGHGGWVTSIACAATGDGVLSGSRDRSLIQWEIGTDNDAQQCGTPMRRLDGHSNFVQDVQVSDDGKFGISAAWDGTLRLWDLVTQAPPRRPLPLKKKEKKVKVIMSDSQGHFSYKGQLRGHGGWVTSIACAATGDGVLSGSRDRSLIQWEIGTDNDAQQCGTPMRRLDGHSNFVQDVQASDDGKFGISAAWDGTLRLWDLVTQRRRSQIATVKKKNSQCCTSESQSQPGLGP
ncbi:Guanine nucleotide-binding protein subunit beta-like protein [Diplonema papillatum]|nr:Guanine nucleotide-binding protein subunit beta-like protein [Diplonema papillatum]